MIHANTPSYVGSHVTGFANMVRAMVDYFAEPAEDKTATINLIPGWVEPADMREIKRWPAVLGVETIVFPDTSDVLDAPQTGKHEFYPKGGVDRSSSLRATGGQPGHAGPGPDGLRGRRASSWRPSSKCPFEVLELPIGLRATDRFINTLRQDGRRQGPGRRSPRSAAG